ncbi:MAG: protoporphyrinogen oxidase HemJ [Alphaproteobacteria bacterium]|nr:protoporphyrinogen oxidase HemJ [Alphaproteobacteria bacterium]
MSYEWVKALHVLSIIAWMAGLLYLPRLFVYHCQVDVGSAQSELFKVMERRLLRAIMNPAMIASWIFGLWLMVLIEGWALPWFHAKLLAVVLMTAAHMAMARWRKDFEADRNRRTERFYRIANEVPTVLMLAAVILAIVEPF